MLQIVVRRNKLKLKCPDRNTVNADKLLFTTMFNESNETNKLIDSTKAISNKKNIHKASRDTDNINADVSF